MNNFTKLDETGLSKVNGTSLKGYVLTTYDNLVEIFGEPTFLGSEDGKTTAEWIIEFEDGLVATIYDWKMGETPMDLYEWHVGGNSVEVVKRIEDLKEFFSQTQSI